MSHDGDNTCERVIGSLKRYVGGSKLTDEAWQMMQRYHPKPPYYFAINDEGRLVPETAPQQRILPAPSPEVVKQANANQPEPIELDPPFDDEVPF